MQKPLRPKLYLLLKEEGYSFLDFSKDAMAGLIVGILALPMSIAFAIASGVRPEQGLYTAIIAGFLIALLGGSRVQISGPTGAFVVLIYSTVQAYGYDGLVIATIMAGLILIAMGRMRFGAMIKFVPYPVTIGFTSGLSVVLFTGQIRDLLGLKLTTVPLDFVEKWYAYFANIQTINYYALFISLLSIAIVVFWPRVSKKIPGALIAIFISTTLVYLCNFPLETIGDRFGEIPNTFPIFRIPLNVGWEEMMRLVSPAIAIALLAGMESLLSAVVADGMTGKRHISDMELIAGGVGNIFSALFGGIPATGAISRTATNIRNGGKTPIAAIIHVLTLVFILLFFGKLVKLIPMATLGAVIAVVAYNMSEWRHFARLFLSPKHDILILLTTFFLTVFVDLITAIEAGVVLSAFLFMQHMSSSSKGAFLKKEKDQSNARNLPDGIEVFTIQGPFFFAAVEKFKVALSGIHYIPKVLILCFENVPMIDATGVRLLDDVWEKAKRDKTLLLFSEVNKNLYDIFDRSGLLEKVGKNHLFSDLDKALTIAYNHIELKKLAVEVSL
ncbi:MAG: STAS domain-containing protein [Chlamydiae bacterium]|nr:STAS domain-containing protein [Chlamydiota bacterium]